MTSAVNIVSPLIRILAEVKIKRFEVKRLVKKEKKKKTAALQQMKVT